MKSLGLRVLVLGALSGMLTGAALAEGAGAWRGLIGKRVEVTCQPEFPLGSVWGTDVYTDDTDVCSAAVHAGVITRVSGGVVTIEMRAGQKRYPGSTRNDITSGTWEEWGGSFVVVSGKPGRASDIPSPPSNPRRPSGLPFDPPALLGPVSDRMAPVGFGTVTPGVNLTWAIADDDLRRFGLESYVEIQVWDAAQGVWLPLVSTYTEDNWYALGPPALEPESYYAWRVSAVERTPSGQRESASDWWMFRTGRPGDLGGISAGPTSDYRGKPVVRSS